MYYGDGDGKNFNKVKDVYQASGITVKKKSVLVIYRKGWVLHYTSWNEKIQAWQGGES